MTVPFNEDSIREERKMREILLQSGSILLWIFIVMEAVVFGLLIKEYLNGRKMAAMLSVAVGFGLLYDAFIMAFGGVIGTGPVLKGISQMRFVFHGVLVPLLLPICTYMLDAKKTTKRIIWIVTLVIMALGLAEGVATKTDPVEMAGIIRYASNDATPRWAEAVTRVLSFGTVIPLIGCGIALGIKKKNWNLMISGIAMFALAALGPATGNFDLIFLISVPGELLMMLFIWLGLRKQSKGKEA